MNILYVTIILCCCTMNVGFGSKKQISINDSEDMDFLGFTGVYRPTTDSFGNNECNKFFNDSNKADPLPSTAKDLESILNNLYGKKKAYSYFKSNGDGWVYWVKPPHESEKDCEKFFNDTERYFKNLYKKYENYGENIWWSKKLIQKFWGIGLGTSTLSIQRDKDLTELFLWLIASKIRFIKKYQNNRTVPHCYDILKTDEITINIAKKLRTALMKLTANTYLIHVNIQQEYLISFLGSFFEYLQKDKKLKSAISLVRIMPEFIKGEGPLSKNGEFETTIEGSVPPVTIYLNKMTGSIKDTNKKVSQVIKKLTEWYACVEQDMWLLQPPDLCYKINDLFYLESGSAVEKIHLLSSTPTLAKKIFSADNLFYKGHEYVPQDVSQKHKKLPVEFWGDWDNRSPEEKKTKTIQFPEEIW